MAQRALVGAIAVRRGHQSSPRHRAPHPASTGHVGCQYKPAQLASVCAANALARLGVGPPNLQLQPSAPALARRPPGETRRPSETLQPRRGSGQRPLITAAVRQALFGLHGTELRKKLSFPLVPVDEGPSLASRPTCDHGWTVNLQVG